MPTGARLMSAITYGLLAYFASFLVHAALEAEADATVNIGSFRYIITGLGALVGWIVMGKRVGDGVKFAISGGILTSVALVFWGLIVFSLHEMILESTKMRYNGATEAIIDVFRIALDYGQTIATVPFILLMLIGGFVGGYMAEWANSRFR